MMHYILYFVISSTHSGRGSQGNGVPPPKTEGERRSPAFPHNLTTNTKLRAVSLRQLSFLSITLNDCTQISTVRRYFTLNLRNGTRQRHNHAVLILTCTLPYSSRYDMKVIIVDQLTCNPKYVNFILLIELPIRRIPYQLHCKLCQLTR